MLSQNTAITLADLYAAYFGINYGRPFLQRRARNQKLSDFLYKIGFHDEWRRNAMSERTPSEVKEFILGFYTGRFLNDADENGLDEDEKEELRQNISLALAQGILNEVKGVFNSASDSFRETSLQLLALLENDGYHFFRSKLLTNEQLILEFGVLFNPETKKFVDMKETTHNEASETLSAEQFLLQAPLYQSYDLDSDDHIRIIHQLGLLKHTIDSYCLECDLPSTFQPERQHFDPNNPTIDREFSVVLVCSRAGSHRMKFFFRVKNNSITKVGQYPSIGDLVLPGTKKYKRSLGSDYAEFTRAIGLAAHGIGVGSFVYLRRVFENLIERAHDVAIQDADWRQTNEPDFLGKRMNEKILLLKDQLPSFLVENREMYSILSKGIHDLSETECLKYFPVVRTGIQLLLDEELERRARREKTSTIQKEIETIKSAISKEPAGSGDGEEGR